MKFRLFMIKALWRPYGTRLIGLILPGTAVPGYRLFRPCGTALLREQFGFVSGHDFSRAVETQRDLGFKAWELPTNYGTVENRISCPATKDRVPHPSRCWRRVGCHCSPPETSSPKLLLIPPFAENAKDVADTAGRTDVLPAVAAWGTRSFVAGQEIPGLFLLFAALFTSKQPPPPH